MSRFRNILVVERAYRPGSAAIFADGVCLWHGPIDGVGTDGAWPRRLCAGLAAADATIAGLDAVVVGLGPGSFSGIRSALAFAHGLSLPSGIPVLGVGSAAALAARCSRTQGASTVAVVGDARRGLAWVGCFGSDDKPRHTADDFSLVPWDALSEALPSDALIVTPEFVRISERLSAQQAPQQRLRDGGIPDARSIGDWLVENPGRARTAPLPIYLHPAVAVTRAGSSSAKAGRLPAPRKRASRGAT